MSLLLGDVSGFWVDVQLVARHTQVNIRHFVRDEMTKRSMLAFRHLTISFLTSIGRLGPTFTNRKELSSY